MTIREQIAARRADVSSSRSLASVYLECERNIDQLLALGEAMYRCLSGTPSFDDNLEDAVRAWRRIVGSPQEAT